MTNEQLETIRILKSEGEKNNSILGIILCGSLVNGTSTEQSDVDVYIVVNEDEWKKRKRKKAYFWGTLHDQDHYPTPVDGKVVSLDFINKISKTGTEAIQSTFENVELIYCNDAKLSEAIKNISKYNLMDRTEKINKYFALMKSNRYKADDDLTNIFQIKQCIIDTVYFACRIVIAKNNFLFPCKKNIEKVLKKCINIPEEFFEQMHKTLESQSLESLDRFFKMMEKYTNDINLDERKRKGYVIENELFWFFNEKPYEEI